MRWMRAIIGPTRGSEPSKASSEFLIITACEPTYYAISFWGKRGREEKREEERRREEGKERGGTLMREHARGAGGHLSHGRQALVIP